MVKRKTVSTLFSGGCSGHSSRDLFFEVYSLIKSILDLNRCLLKSELSCVVPEYPEDISQNPQKIAISLSYFHGWHSSSSNSNMPGSNTTIDSRGVRKFLWRLFLCMCVVPFGNLRQPIPTSHVWFWGDHFVHHGSACGLGWWSLVG